MIIRNDVLPGGEATRDIKDLLLEAGGKNPFGEPNYRLTLSEHTRSLQGGLWNEWPNGASVQDRGGLVSDGEEFVTQEKDGETVPLTHKPLRTVAEMRWVKRYPSLKGWILQEWWPASRYGSPQEWALITVPDHPDLCRLGPYPSDGDYELAAPNAIPFSPPLSALRTALQFIARQRDMWAGMTPAARRLLRENQYQEQKLLTEAAEHQRKRDIIRDAMSPLWSSSLEAGRVREGWAKGAGVKSHVGN